MEVLLKRFSNPGNRNELDECCDGMNSSSCSDGCDTFFVVCINKPNSKFPNCLGKGHSGITNSSETQISTFPWSQPSLPSRKVSITNPHNWPVCSLLYNFFADVRIYIWCCKIPLVSRRLRLSLR